LNSAEPNPTPARPDGQFRRPNAVPDTMPGNASDPEHAVRVVQQGVVPDDDRRSQPSVAAAAGCVGQAEGPGVRPCLTHLKIDYLAELRGIIIAGLVLGAIFGGCMGGASVLIISSSVNELLGAVLLGAIFGSAILALFYGVFVGFILMCEFLWNVLLGFFRPSRPGVPSRESSADARQSGDLPCAFRSKDRFRKS
jgi:hypothetical protein